MNNGNVLVQRYSTLGAKGTFYRTRTSAGTWAAWASVADYGAGDGLTLDAATNDFAVDDTVIRDSGSQSIAGTKTFTGTLTGTGTVNLPPATYVPTMGTTSTAVANKAYADTKVSLTGNQSIAGVKDFASFPTVPTATNPTADNQLVSKKYADSLAFNITRLLMLPDISLLVPAPPAQASPRHGGNYFSIAAAPAGMQRVVSFVHSSYGYGGGASEALGGKKLYFKVNPGETVDIANQSIMGLGWDPALEINGVVRPDREVSGGIFLGEFSGIPNTIKDGHCDDGTCSEVWATEYLMPIP